VEVLRKQDLDLSRHESQPVTDQIVRHADLILTMTRGHRAAIVEHWPEAAGRTMLLLPSEQDVADPIGQPVESYRACAGELDAGVAHHAQRIISELACSQA
jgi:protein-tyrosine phosphatase